MKLVVRVNVKELVPNFRFSPSVYKQRLLLCDDLGACREDTGLTEVSGVRNCVFRISDLFSKGVNLQKSENNNDDKCYMQNSSCSQ